MLAPKEEVIAEFYSKVNMTIEELEAWMDSDESKTAGTPEGVGQESGRKIIEILKKNPSKEHDKFVDVSIRTRYTRKDLVYSRVLG
jgi:hypothetical protein